MFGYGFLAVVLVLYLDASASTRGRSGSLLTLTLLGDTVISLWLTTHADRIGRRRVLIAGALLMVVAGHRLRLDRAVAVADRRRDHRRHQPERQRGRPVPGRRAGVAEPDDPRRAPDRDVRLVQPRGLRRDRGRARWRRASSARRSSRPAWRRPTPTARSSSATPLVGLVMVVAVLAGRRGRRGAAGRRRRRRDPPPPRAAPVAADRRSACRSSSRSTPSAAGSSRRASSPTGSTTGSASTRRPRRDLLRRQPAGRRVVASAARLAARFGLINTMVFTHLPVERPADPRAADADPAAGGPGPARSASASARWTCRPASPTRWRSSTRTSARPPPASPASPGRPGAALSPPSSAPLFASAGLAAVPFFLAGGLKIVYDLLLYRAFRPVGRRRSGRDREG